MHFYIFFTAAYGLWIMTSSDLPKPILLATLRRQLRQIALPDGSQLRKGVEDERAGYPRTILQTVLRADAARGTSQPNFSRMLTSILISDVSRSRRGPQRAIVRMSISSSVHRSTSHSRRSSASAVLPFDGPGVQQAPRFMQVPVNQTYRGSHYLRLNRGRIGTCQIRILVASVKL